MAKTKSRVKSEANRRIFWVERKQLMVERLRYEDNWILEGEGTTHEAATPHSDDNSDSLEWLWENMRIWKTIRNGGQAIMILAGRDDYGWKSLGETLFHFIRVASAWNGKETVEDHLCESGCLGTNSAAVTWDTCGSGE
ncbi:hypothetical protein Syun_009502 [Stephania yunnanensis]|uniref:Uncharacterized protein n=1 Tax=Stephania yunnanensis TaxID=152371 RepID=A0AAP0PNL5_9MAGN